MNRGRQKSIHKVRKVTVYSAHIINRLKAVEIKFLKPAFCFINKLHFQNHCHRIYQNVVPDLDISTVSVNATTSALSIVAVKSPMPTSATPLLTSDTVPVHDPLPDLEPYESVSWTTVLLASVRN